MSKKNCSRNNEKKKLELDKLQLTLRNGMNSLGVDTKRICTDLYYSEIDCTEAPDFLLTDNDKKICYGIEHFRVDHHIREQHGRIGASSLQFEKVNKEIFDKYKDNIGNNYLKAMNEINKNVVEELNRTFNASYEDLLASFRYSLGKKNKKIETYIANCERKKCTLYELKLVFFIEVVTDFSRLYRCGYRFEERNVSGLMPLFEDVLNLLKSKQLKKVDYYVLLLKNYLNAETMVVAIDNNNFEKSLRNNGIRPVKNCLYEKYIRSKDTNAVDLFIKNAIQDGDKIISPYTIDYNLCKSGLFVPAVHTAAREAMRQLSCREEVVMEYSTLFFVFVYGKNVRSWKKLNSSGLYVASQIEIDKLVETRRIKRFDSLFPLNEISVDI